MRLRNGASKGRLAIGARSFERTTANHDVFPPRKEKLEDIETQYTGEEYGERFNDTKERNGAAS